VWISPFFLELILAQAIYGVEATRPYSSAIELARSCMSLYFSFRNKKNGFLAILISFFCDLF
jgi:hypothetical protein